MLAYHIVTFHRQRSFCHFLVFYSPWLNVCEGMAKQWCGHRVWLRSRGSKMMRFAFVSPLRCVSLSLYLYLFLCVYVCLKKERISKKKWETKETSLCLPPLGFFPDEIQCMQLKWISLSHVLSLCHKTKVRISYFNSLLVLNSEFKDNKSMYFFCFSLRKTTRG